MIPLLTSPESLTAFGERADAVETALDLLANQRRYAVLDHLEGAGGSATLTELAVEIATRETRTEPNVISDHADVSPRDRRAVSISLHHTHIPKLASADVVDYATETETVTLRDRGRTLLDRQNAVSEPV
ncbi:DUF7344 domain-containing protein [Natrinema longum]|uniref:DUF7344 domain-containing protein n=1 Tax=Natrinema longum TaxID=370324 RepID=A0A8A2UDA0_9EURY|nr:hypothetical protein [Natrinema longum]MBZ6496220.1 hypothetical protein [Natrinema longum]QSW85858.1 hypothetical protein J0X27_03210 [Natrinema longum]